MVAALGLPSWSNANYFHFKLCCQYLKPEPCACKEILNKKVPKMGQVDVLQHKISP